MKCMVLFVLAIVVLTVGQAFAQNSDVIFLNQANPSAQMSITLPQNSTGVIAISVNQASVQLADSLNNVVFSSADPRVHLIELSIAPNTGSHLLTVTPLPGAASAALQVNAQPALTQISGTGPVMVTGRALDVQQSEALPLNSANPAGTVNLTIPQNTTGVVTATFTGVSASAVLTDAGGAVIASSSRDIDGFNFVLDSGSYRFNLLANSVDQPVTATVQLMPASQFQLLALPQPPTSTPYPTSTPLPPICTATVNASSANLRSGPGTSYSVLNTATLGDNFTVSGVSPDNSWLYMNGSAGSVWISSGLVQLSGSCSSLPVVDNTSGN